jgi:5'-3' exonuclease
MEGMSAPARTLYLLDASMYVFRAWHSMPHRFFDMDGAPVNAVHGFTRFLIEFVERTRPTHALAAFDISLTSSFRNTFYPAYKANRDPAPPELKRQFEYCREVAAALGFCVLADVAYEADDLIGSAQAALRVHGFRSVIVSADKDFGQLLDGDDEQWDYARNLRWHADGVRAKMGVHARQVVDFLALTGDAIDNIPGVPGIGPRTAAALLEHFGTLDEVLARLDEVSYLAIRGAPMVGAKLRAHAEQALLSRRLAAIALDAPVPRAPEALLRRVPDALAMDALFERVRLGPMTRARAQKLVDSFGPSSESMEAVS